MNKVIPRRVLHAHLEYYGKSSENNGRSGILQLILLTEHRWWPNTEVR